MLKLDWSLSDEIERLHWSEFLVHNHWRTIVRLTGYKAIVMVANIGRAEPLYDVLDIWRPTDVKT